MKIQWTELAKKQLEARVYCRACNKSHLVTANNNAFFWAAFKTRPVIVTACDHCKQPIRVKIAPDGLEHLL